MAESDKSYVPSHRDRTGPDPWCVRSLLLEEIASVSE